MLYALASMPLSDNRPWRALLFRTDPFSLFLGHRLVRFILILQTISGTLLSIELNRFSMVELSSIEAALNPVLLIHLPWISHLRIRLTMDHTAH